MLRYRALLIGFLALIASFSVHAESKTVTLGTSVWPPYISYEESTDSGYAYDIVKKAFEVMGYQVSIEVMCWNKAKKLAMEGKIDGLFPDYLSKTNEHYFLYSDAFLAGPLVLYEKIDNASSKSPIVIPETNNQKDLFNQLKHYRFGVVAGYTNVPAFDENSSLKKIAVVDDKANLEQLYNGKVDLILIDALNGQYIIDNELPPEHRSAFKRVGPVLARLPLYVVFSKKSSNAELLNKDFNAGLQKLKDQKITYQIMQKYLSSFIDVQAGPKKIGPN